MISGSCLCGGIKYEINGEVAMTRICHCVNCRKFSGTANAAWGLAQVADFSQTASDAEVGEYDAGSGSLRKFCMSCGSPLWFEPKDLPAFVGIALGSIDDGNPALPEMHVWMRSSPDWEDISDSLPQHLTHP
ncbi:MAG: GFA family protein [Pseudomonadales bacterium]|nr:GFA family protein [Pseudomonadales bacterium]